MDHPQNTLQRCLGAALRGLSSGIINAPREDGRRSSKMDITAPVLQSRTSVPRPRCRSFPLICKDTINNFLLWFYFIFFSPNKCLKIPARAGYHFMGRKPPPLTPPPLLRGIFICKAYAKNFSHSFGTRVAFSNSKTHPASIVSY